MAKIVGSQWAYRLSYKFKVAGKRKWDTYEAYYTSEDDARTAREHAHASMVNNRGAGETKDVKVDPIHIFVVK